MDAEPLADAVADRRPRVQRRIGILEDDLNLASVRFEGCPMKRRDVCPVEQDGA